MRVMSEFLEAYEVVVEEQRKCFRTLKLPVSKLEEPAKEALALDISQMTVTYDTTHFIQLNRKDKVALRVDIKFRLYDYDRRKPVGDIAITAVGVNLDTPQKISGFASLLKKGGRTHADMLAYLNAL